MDFVYTDIQPPENRNRQHEFVRRVENILYHLKEDEPFYFELNDLSKWDLWKIFSFEDYNVPQIETLFGIPIRIRENGLNNCIVLVTKKDYMIPIAIDDYKLYVGEFYTT